MITELNLEMLIESQFSVQDMPFNLNLTIINLTQKVILYKQK
jgi:hypothetical protein